MEARFHTSSAYGNHHNLSLHHNHLHHPYTGITNVCDPFVVTNLACKILHFRVYRVLALFPFTLSRTFPKLTTDYL